MQLNGIKPGEGAKHYKRRVGRGIGSGIGKTAGRGHKGQKSRAGGYHKVGFEGGQMPMHRRLPKRGFVNPTRKEYALVNIEDLNSFAADTEVTPTFLMEQGIVKNARSGIKILGNGDITVKLTVKANKFSQSAVEKIEAAGGKTEVI